MIIITGISLNSRGVYMLEYLVGVAMGFVVIDADAAKDLLKAFAHKEVKSGDRLTTFVFTTNHHP